jgi:hypothetical protein
MTVWPINLADATWLTPAVLKKHWFGGAPGAATRGKKRWKKLRRCR